MVGVGGIGTKRNNGGKARALAAVGTEAAVNELGHLALGHACFYVVFCLLIDKVVDAGGFAHQGLLGLILAGAAVVHAVTGKAHRHGRVGLHQRDQEPGGPFFVDAKRFFGIHHSGDLFYGCVGIGMPDGLARRVGHVEQLI